MNTKAKDDAGRINIRPARDSDKAVVLGFCKHTFGRWGDYMPEVWDEWVKTRNGLFFAATINDVPVGVGKITIHRPGELWLEGLRVNPKYRGCGIGRIIQNHAWKKAMSLKPKYVRYATGSYNKISQHLGQSKSMKIVAGFDEYISKLTDTTETALVRAKPKEGQEYLSLFNRDRQAKYWKGLYLDSWSAKTFDKQALDGLIKQKRVYGYYGHRGLAGGLVILQSKDKKFYNYCRAAALDPKTFQTILKEGRKLGRLLGAKKTEMHLPKSAWFRNIVKGTGWRKAMPIWMVVLEWSRKL
ncbi:GNAT family N-acetyltransferase [candidate division TA06 bacterium]|uniref:GNAT family N-acetyltransferase n=1 Tax=candidate division TA06 bacterium TaxID=2250710 RepID=A0A933MJL1_UNCT6|nr:GNAT family N-acetyltransferase [candidate division TA06 bacterium]